MTAFLMIAAIWVVFSVVVLLFASMASARFTQIEEEPEEARHRQTLRRDSREVPATSLGQAHVQN
jgi:hypothetical protein